jgi:hypothetical protein
MPVEPRDAVWRGVRLCGAHPRGRSRAARLVLEMISCRRLLSWERIDEGRRRGHGDLATPGGRRAGGVRRPGEASRRSADRSAGGALAIRRPAERARRRARMATARTPPLHVAPLRGRPARWPRARLGAELGLDARPKMCRRR